MIPRRQAISQIAIGMSSMLSLPAWAHNWRRETIAPTAFLTTDDTNTLAEIVETIIPQTDTPGAKALGVHLLIARIVKDCYGKPAQDNLTSGIKLTDELSQKLHNKSFVEATPDQRLATLTAMSKADDASQRQFYGMVRQMTIRGYTNSKYYLTNVAKFEFAPARFYGCRPLTAR